MKFTHALACAAFALSGLMAHAAAKKAKPVPAAPEVKITTTAGFADVYKKTHTCDLSKFNTGTYTSASVKCLNSGVPVEKVEVSLEGASMRWRLFRDGKPTLEDTDRIVYQSVANNTGLCRIKTIYTSMACNDDDAPCVTVAFIGTNTQTGDFEMVIPADKLLICKGADKGSVEQVVTFRK